MLAADWPPVLDRKNPTPQSVDGRRIERFTHGARPDWGYPESMAGEWGYPAPEESGKTQQIHNSFYVVTPQKPYKNAPLCVVLHSANRTGFDYMAAQFLNRKVDGNGDPAQVMTRIPDNCYGLYLNSTNGEWWGWGMAHQDLKKYANAPTPVEKRVFDTLEWVVTRYKIDRNRIYLTGVSMGGCGTLGLGIPHGDVFAAILADVPAGTNYVAFRRGFPDPLGPLASAEEREIWTQKVSGLGLPDPPVIVDFSAQNDNWSKSQYVLLDAARAGHLPLVLGWGPFGHTTFSTAIVKFPQPDVALAFPWHDIRKDAAYPVFTNASSDQRCPWIGTPATFDESGQINAYFRWKDEQDEPSKFTMQLWLAHPTVNNPPAMMPDTSTVDVTLRRLQRFQVQPMKTYTWQLVRDGKPVASGKITPDTAHLLTIPQIILTTTPAELAVKVDIP